MPIFVVQKHAARALHYDFRLEIDEALASWAVPKGPSLNPREKRLAIRVEDHALDYANFEGVLGPGYGAGAVIVWDTGEYSLVSGSLDEGHLVADLHGRKLRGGFALTRTGRDADRERWLLVKVNDSHADRERDIVAEEPASVLSGGTVEDLLGEGMSFAISHPEKVMFPSAEGAPAITKRELVEYYEGVAEVMVPHVRDRPVSMQQFPGGIGRPGFFRKDVPDHFRGEVPTVEVPKRGGTVRHALVRSAGHLAYLANQNCVTPHVWLSRADRLERPDRLILDLDPSRADDFDRIRAAARALGALLRDLGLEPFAMATGSRGVHVTVPLQRRQDFSAVRAFATDVAALMAARHPDVLTTEFRKAKRGDRILVDVARNAWAQTAVPPYAVRPRPGAPVAVPLRWRELSDPRLRPDRHTIRTLARRLERGGDPWADIGAHARGLGEASERLARQFIEGSGGMRPSSA